MAVPPEKLEVVAQTVNRFPEVNHNYEREHERNLWFVITGGDAAAVAEFAQRWGWETSSPDWREVVNRKDVDVVDISTPGYTHDEIAIAAAAAGKHVFCEKPLCFTVAQAKEIGHAPVTAQLEPDDPRAAPMQRLLHAVDVGAEIDGARGDPE